MIFNSLVSCKLLFLVLSLWGLQRYGPYMSVTSGNYLVLHLGRLITFFQIV